MVLSPGIHPPIVVELVPTIGHDILELPELLREVFVMLDKLFNLLVQLTAVTHEDGDEHLTETVQKQHMHDDIDQMFDHISKESKRGHVKNVEEG
jgi:hypothetical protein